MDGLPSETGLSIFQGAGQLQLDTGNESELEEEAAADQQRRDQELQKLLTNAFDDLYDENDDQSTYSSIPVSEHNSGDDENDPPQSDSIADIYRAALFENDEQRPQYILEEGSMGSRYHYTNDDADSNVPNGMERLMNRMNLADTMSHQHDVEGAGGDSTSVSALHYQHCFRTSPGGVGSGDVRIFDENEQYRQTPIGSMEQLQVLYEVRVREVGRLSQQLETVTKAATREKDELRRQVAFRVAEKERAKLLYQQTQSLLADSKGKIADLEKQVSTLEATVKSLENTKADLSEKLESSKISIEDLHQKILLMERGSLNNTEKHLDAFLRNVQNMHSQQIKKLEDELALAVAKLSVKETDLEQHKRDATSRQQQLEARLAEKGDTVNQMARSLEEAQRQCQNLMSKGATQEVVHLQMRLTATEKECQTLAEKLHASERKTEKLQSDLKQYEAVLKEELLQDVPEDSELVGLCGNNEGQLVRELQRALLGQKLKREEIIRLTDELETCSQERHKFQEKENEFETRLKQIENKYAAVLGEKNELKNCLTETQNKLEEQKCVNEELRQQMSSRIDEALTERKVELLQKTRELSDTQEQCRKLKEEIRELKNKRSQDLSGEYLRFHEEKLAKSIDACNLAHKTELEKVSAELEQARKEGDGVKELYINVCRSKDELLSLHQKEKDKVKELELQILRLRAQQEAREHIEGSSRQSQTDAQNLGTQLELQKGKIDKLLAENKVLVEKLENGMDNLEAAQKAVSETVKLQAELTIQKDKQQQIEEHYKEEISKLQIEKENLVQELENRSKKVYAEQVTEEIEKVKVNALLELKKNWQENNGKETLVAKIKQLEEDHGILQKQFEAAVQRHAEDTAVLSHHLEQEKSQKAKLIQELAFKEEEANRVNFGNFFSDDTTGSSNTEKIKKEMMVAFAAKVKALQTQHQAQLNETSERVKDETIRFCVQQIRQTEDKYFINLKKCKEAYAEQVEKLHSALSDSEARLAQTAEKLRETNALLEKERSLDGNNSKWKTKVLALEEQLKSVEIKAENAEKTLDITKVKYQAAKKAVYKCKKFIHAQQKHMEKEWERINVGYQKTLSEVGQVQQRLTKLVSKEEINYEI